MDNLLITKLSYEASDQEIAGLTRNLPPPLSL